MPKMIFINLPVTDLERSISFYEAIGGRKEPKFSNEQAAMIVLSDTIHVMLLTHAKWAGFNKKPIVDAHLANEVMLALTFESRDAVAAIVEAAGKAGGVADVNALQDYGFMLDRTFADPDGHVWEAVWMDPAAMPAQH